VVRLLQKDIEPAHTALGDVMRDFGTDRPWHSCHRCRSGVLANTPLHTQRATALCDGGTNVTKRKIRNCLQLIGVCPRFVRFPGFLFREIGEPVTIGAKDEAALFGARAIHIERGRRPK
jgi:hypothetical protein